MTRQEHQALISELEVNAYKAKADMDNATTASAVTKAAQKLSVAESALANAKLKQVSVQKASEEAAEAKKRKDIFKDMKKYAGSATIALANMQQIEADLEKHLAEISQAWAKAKADHKQAKVDFYFKGRELVAEFSSGRGTHDDMTQARALMAEIEKEGIDTEAVRTVVDWAYHLDGKRYEGTPHTEYLTKISDPLRYKQTTRRNTLIPPSDYEAKREAQVTQATNAIIKNR